MSKIQPSAIVLGGTVPHIALLENLKARGYYTILVDYYENPIASSAADGHIRESILDMDVVLEIAKKRDAKLVIGTCVDKANVTACYVGEKLGLPIPYSYECASSISNKSTMKAIMTKAGIPTAKFISVKDGDTYDLGDLQFPLVVKPTDGNSSKGVRRADNIGELDAALVEAFSLARSKTVVIEEFMQGVEVSVNSFVVDKKAHILYIMQRLIPQTNNGAVLFGNLSVTPANISEAANANILKTIEMLATAFDLDNTPLLLQAMVDGDNVNVIEFAPRIGGGDSSIKIKCLNKCDIVDAAINSYMGKKVSLNYIRPKCMYTSYYIYTEPGVFGEIQNYEGLIEDGTLVYLYATKTRGMPISTGRESTNRIAYFCATGDTREELVLKVRKAINTIKVLDVNGNELKIADHLQLLCSNLT